MSSYLIRLPYFFSAEYIASRLKQGSEYGLDRIVMLIGAAHAITIFVLRLFYIYSPFELNFQDHAQNRLKKISFYYLGSAGRKNGTLRFLFYQLISLLIAITTTPK